MPGTTHPDANPGAFRWLVRAGFFARGLTYGIIGGLALALALGAGGSATNQQGALSLIARAPLGAVALVMASGGFLAYALWKLWQGALGHGPEGGGGASFKDRISNLAGAAVYVGFFAVAVGVLTNSGGSQSSAPRSTTAGVLGWPGGRFLVGLAGVGLLAISIYQIYDAVSGGFADQIKTGQLSETAKRWLLRLGRIGLSARALVFALIGYFLLRAAIDYRPEKAIGVDGALREVHRQAYGAALLTLVAAGLLVFAAFSLVEGRYRRL